MSSRLPAVVVTDLDGTLLRSDRTVSARTRAALDAVVASGSRLVFATGRPRRWLAPVVEASGHAGVAVASNGALVLDLDTDETLLTLPFGEHAITSVVAHLRAELDGVLLGVEWADGFAHEARFREGTSRAGGDSMQPEAIVADDAGLTSRPVLKLLARHPGMEHVGRAVAEVLGDRGKATWSTSGALAEVSAPGVHKASTLARLVAGWGLGPQDVVAFGDMPNDSELLRWAGHGVAMGNADRAALDAADETAESNDDDGVALVLERLLA